MENKLFFIYTNLEKFFSAKAEYRVLHNVIAPGNDWEFLIYLDSSTPAPLINSMLLELTNFTIALPTSALRVQV